MIRFCKISRMKMLSDDRRNQNKNVATKRSLQKYFLPFQLVGHSVPSGCFEFSKLWHKINTIDFNTGGEDDATERRRGFSRHQSRPCSDEINKKAKTWLLKFKMDSNDFECFTVSID